MRPEANARPNARPSASLARGLACAAVAFAIGAIAAAGACLPDLGPLPAEVAPAAPPACGDTVVATSADGGGEQCDPGDASVRGCESCIVTCPEGTLDPVTRHCYFAVEPQDSLARATNACGALGGHVVTIHSAKEAATALAVAGGRPHWVGLSFDGLVGAYAPTAVASLVSVSLGLEPGWPEPPTTGPCPGCFGFGLDGGGFALPDGGEAPPDTCVAAMGTEAGAWQGVPCATSQARATVCEREPVGHVLPQFCGGLRCFSIAPTVTTKLYVVASEPGFEKTADEASAACGDGKLVTFATPEERVELVRALDDLLGVGEVRELWIGVRFDEAESAWIWDDGMPESMRAVPWGDRQPDPGAAGRAYMRVGQTYDTGLVYASATTTTKRLYVCETKP